MNYIKNYPEIFETTLEENIENKYGAASVLISNFITPTENKKTRKQSFIVGRQNTLSNTFCHCLYALYYIKVIYKLII